MEDWKVIQDYPNYEVSNMGQVRNITTGILLKQSSNKGGYYYLSLHKDGIQKRATVHRLVGLAFIENPNNLPQIDHINEIRIDNRVENLRWLSHKDNCRRQKQVVGASINYHKYNNRWAVQYYINGKRKHKYFKIDNYDSAEQFYFECCGDFEDNI